VCDRFSVWAAMRSIEELAASRVIEETKES
jgi:hypothetical protein